MTTRRCAQVGASARCHALGPTVPSGLPETGERERRRDMATRQSTTSRDDAMRARLLAGAPVVERRLWPADIPTAVLEGGDGPPVLLLHGPAANAAHWLPVFEGL